MIKHYYNIISTINKHYVACLYNKQFVEIKELENISYKEILNVVHIEYNLINIILENSKNILLEVKHQNYMEQLKYDIQDLKDYSNLVIEASLNTRKNTLQEKIIIAKQTICLKPYNLNSRAANNYSTYPHKLFLKDQKNFEATQIIDNVIYVGKKEYKDGYHYIIVFTTSKLYVIKINKNNKEIIFICNIDFDYNIIEDYQTFGIIKKNKYYRIPNSPYNLAKLKMNGTGDRFYMYVEHETEYDKYGVDNIILINGNYITLPKWCTSTHKYYGIIINELIVLILLCNKYTKFKKIPKWLLYDLFRLIL